jgi:hypothetical protein
MKYCLLIKSPFGVNSVLLMMSMILLVVSCQTVRTPKDDTSSLMQAEVNKLCEGDQNFRQGIFLATNKQNCKDALLQLDKIRAGSADFDHEFEQLVMELSRKM